MEEEWLAARDALAFLQRVAPLTDQRRTICARAHAGLIQARAETLILPSGKHSNANIGEDFWWAEGGAALNQNWTTGDFSTWINQKFQVKAFGVSFLADDIYAVVPGSGVKAGRWIDCADAVEHVADAAAVSTDQALAAIIHCCANRLIESWCRALNCQYPDSYDPDDEIEDGVMPTWFWMTSARHPDAILNWRSGNFAGPGETEGGYCQAQAKGVSFARASLSDAIEYATRNKTISVAPSPETSDASKAPLSNADLEKWWNKRANVRDGLSQDDLLILVRADFPDNHISRDRIRVLTGERKRGPKP
ncbi:hypothetical protein [Sphingopyxis sp. PET50]|uniref:hypothetical protein n=1 Tax=Sphingopyxis sp. PET50 TaxID=2976533 RepID=UPI0021AF9934|nr:hypothetical protein [Sphingopyxis sp. PET50]